MAQDFPEENIFFSAPGFAASLSLNALHGISLYVFPDKIYLNESKFIRDFASVKM